MNTKNIDMLDYARRCNRVCKHHLETHQEEIDNDFKRYKDSFEDSRFEVPVLGCTSFHAFLDFLKRCQELFILFAKLRHQIMFMYSLRCINWVQEDLIMSSELDYSNSLLYNYRGDKQLLFSWLRRQPGDRKVDVIFSMVYDKEPSERMECSKVINDAIDKNDYTSFLLLTDNLGIQERTIFISRVIEWKQDLHNTFLLSESIVRERNNTNYNVSKDAASILNQLKEFSDTDSYSKIENEIKYINDIRIELSENEDYGNLLVFLKYIRDSFKCELSTTYNTQIDLTDFECALRYLQKEERYKEYVDVATIIDKELFGGPHDIPMPTSVPVNRAKVPSKNEYHLPAGLTTVEKDDSSCWINIDKELLNMGKKFITEVLAELWFSLASNGFLIYSQDSLDTFVYRFSGYKTTMSQINDKLIWCDPLVKDDKNSKEECKSLMRLIQRLGATGQPWCKMKKFFVNSNKDAIAPDHVQPNWAKKNHNTLDLALKNFLKDFSRK